MIDLDAARKLADECRKRAQAIEPDMQDACCFDECDDMLRAACEEIEARRKEEELLLAKVVQLERGDNSWTYKAELERLARENDDITPEFKAEHTHTVTRNALDMMAAVGKLAFPNEGCGFVIGDDELAHDEVFAVKNINPHKGGAYLMDPAQQLGILRMADKRGMVLKVIFHSHPNMGAFFSSIDRDEARSINPAKPDWPGVTYIVMSIRAPHRYGTRKKLPAQLAEARAYLWNPAIKDFSEITLKVE